MQYMDRIEHSEMIHYLWTDWKLGHAFPSYEGNAPLTCREGHNLYTKSIYMYLNAHDGWLPVQHPEFLQHLRQCYHAVRHSSWYLSTDLVIKLACMWSLKITQGEGADKMTNWLPRKVPNTKPVAQLDSRKTQMMQIRLSNTWIARIHLMSLCHSAFSWYWYCCP